MFLPWVTQPGSVRGFGWTTGLAPALARVHSARARLFALVHGAPAQNRTEAGRLSSGCTTFVLRAQLSGRLDLPQRPLRSERSALLAELHPESASPWNRTRPSRSSNGRSS